MSRILPILILLAVAGFVAFSQSSPPQSIQSATRQPVMATTPPTQKVESASIASQYVEPTPTPTPIPSRTPSPPPAPRQSGDASNVEAVITKWANHYGVDASWLIRVAKCESGLNPAAINLHYSDGGNPSGVFQFVPPTFYANAKRAGISDPNLWSVEHQSQTAAYMFSIGQHVQWACK